MKEPINVSESSNIQLEEWLIKFRRAEWRNSNDARKYSDILKEIRYRRGY